MVARRMRVRGSALVVALGKVMGSDFGMGWTAQRSVGERFQRGVIFDSSQGAPELIQVSKAVMVSAGRGLPGGIWPDLRSWKRGLDWALPGVMAGPRVPPCRRESRVRRSSLERTWPSPWQPRQSRLRVGWMVVVKSCAGSMARARRRGSGAIGVILCHQLRITLCA